MKDKYVLVTGCAGLLGSRMCDWISENRKDYGILGVDSLFGGYIEHINNDVIFFQRDLCLSSISDIFEKYNVEYVFHFAAYAAEGLSPFMRIFNWENNSVSTANVINNCVNYNVKRLVYTSSMSVYGRGIHEGRIFDEEDQPNPIDPYAISKYACELDIKAAGEQFGLDWCIIRPHNCYGIKQNIWDKYRNVLGIWMYQALCNKPMLIYGDGKQTRSFSYIDDCLEPLWNAAVSEKASKQIINLGGTESISINNACDIVADVIDYHNIKYCEARYEVKHAVPSFQKSIDLLGYHDNTPLREGISKMWEWAKVQPPRQQHIWNRYEINKGIYTYWK